MSSLKPINELLEKFIKKRKLGQKFNEAKAIVLWQEVVGKKISENASPTKVNTGILFVSVKDTVWLNELNCLKPSIIEQLNSRIGQKTIKDIKFYLKY
ncbi:MAG: DUF721 domain-containing protein [candidate division WOR-3 bacterium]|nr:DUF721 domain-containing protein [candidate division WOR-3 bacterium]MDW7987589.1 DUF721 domain-containing protein [candidate division WOR-3 bacterium]